MRSLYRERPDYRVDLLARTNVMTAWLGETCLARSGACLIVDEQDHGLVVYFPPDAGRLRRPGAGPGAHGLPVQGPGGVLAGGRAGRARHRLELPRPFPEVARLAGYVAFDQDEVRVAIGKGRYTGTHR